MEKPTVNFMEAFFGIQNELRITNSDYQEFKLYQKATEIIRLQNKDSKLNISLGAGDDGKEYITIKGYDDTDLLKLGLIKGALEE